ncbi:cyclic nucleotide-binding protein, partial [Kluyvera ascorbata]
MYIKPIKHIQQIIDCVSPYSSVQQVPTGEILDYKIGNVRSCYLLLEGSVTLNRRWDGIILNAQQHPFILGVSHQLSNGTSLYVKTTEPSRLCKMPLERFNLLIEKYALWESFCCLLIYT